MIHAKKHLGQNFLRNKNILNAIVGENSLSGKDILEIGPGPGDLTECILSRHPKSLTVIEIDQDMISLLEWRFGDTITIHHQDVLTVNISDTSLDSSTSISFPDGYEVYGNIPYYITSPILMHFLYGVSSLPESLTITMQKEVADRILARDGKHSVLSLACQLVTDIKKVCDIHPNNFTPIPKVWSTCLRFESKWVLNKTTNAQILHLIKIWFSQKRKKLSSNLAQAGYTKKSIEDSFMILWISENARAEDLTKEIWIQLSKILK